MSTPRPVIRGRTLFTTRRCILRQFLLLPDEQITQAILYCLGVASRDHGVELHAIIAESNHLHNLNTDHLGKNPDFLRDFHQLAAKCVNVHRGRWGNVWADEQTSVVVCVEPKDAFDKMIYIVTNAAKDHLVERAQHWPGVNSLTLQLLDKEITVKRPHWFFDRDGNMPKEVTLRFTRPPGFEHLTHEEWVAKVRAAVADVEATAAKERAKKGTRVLGVKTIKRQKPTDCPTSFEARRGIKPRVACKNKWRRIETLQQNKQWLAAYRAALEAYRAGNKKVLFPHGTHQLAVDTHVRCAPGPGPLAIPYALTLRAA